MSIIIATGFDDDSLGDWIPTNLVVVSSNTPFDSGKSLRIGGQFLGTDYATYYLKEDITEFTASFDFMANAESLNERTNTFFRFGYRDPVTEEFQHWHTKLYCTSSGLLYVLDNSDNIIGGEGVPVDSPTRITPNSWNRIVLTSQISDSGTVKIYFNGELLLDLTGVDTNAGSGAGNMFMLHQLAGFQFRYVYFDNIIISDTFDDSILVSSNNPTVSTPLLPTGDSTVSWEPTSGSSNYLMVDDPGNDDADSTIVYTGAVNDIDVYDLSNISTTAPIKGLLVAAHAAAGTPYLDTSGQIGTPTSFFFKPDGTRVFVLDDGEPEGIYQYDLTTAWDFSETSYSSPGFASLDGEEDGLPIGMHFKSDGTKVYVLYRYVDLGPVPTLVEYDLSTPWDITSLYFTSPRVRKSFATGSFPSGRGVAFNSDGSKLYILSAGSSTLPEYISVYSHGSSPPVAWDFVNFTVREQAFNLGNISVYGIFVNSDETKVWLANNSHDTIREYSIGGSPTWGAYVDQYNVRIPYLGTFPIDVSFSSDGTTLFVLWYDRDGIYQYPLETAWDLSTIDRNSISTLISGGSPYVESTSESLYDDNYLPYTAFYENNPATGVAWTESDINSLLIGIKSKD